MLAIERAGIGRNELPKSAVKNTGYTVAYGPTIRTSTISCGVTFLEIVPSALGQSPFSRLFPSLIGEEDVTVGIKHGNLGRQQVKSL